MKKGERTVHFGDPVVRRFSIYTARIGHVSMYEPACVAPALRRRLHNRGSAENNDRTIHNTRAVEHKT